MGHTAYYIYLRLVADFYWVSNIRPLLLRRGRRSQTFGRRNPATKPENDPRITQKLKRMRFPRITINLFQIGFIFHRVSRVFAELVGEHVRKFQILILGLIKVLR